MIQKIMDHFCFLIEHATGDGLDVHANEEDLGAEEEKKESQENDTRDEEKIEEEKPIEEPKTEGDVRGSSPELEPPPVKKRRESPTHESRTSTHRSAEPRRRDRGSRPPDRMDSDPKWDDARVQISPYMCDMNLKITDNNRAENINYEGLGYCYAGAKVSSYDSFMMQLKLIIMIFIRLLTVFVAVRSVSRFIYLGNYRLVIYMRMKRVFIGAVLDGQPECRISYLAKILVQDSVIFIIMVSHLCDNNLSRSSFMTRIDSWI